MSIRRTLSAGIALAAIAILATALPASAHDRLVSSDPAEGSTLTSAPTQLTLTYSEDLLTLDENTTGAAVQVLDTAGKDWAAGDAAVNGNTVTVPLKSDMPNSAYTAQWDVVSSDGHPTSGVVTFTIAVPEASAPAAPVDTSKPAATTDASPAAEAPAVGEMSGPWRWVAGIGGGAAIIALAVVLVAKLRRGPGAPKGPGAA